MIFDAKLLRSYLIGCARAQETTTYSETLAALGFAFSRPKMRALCRVLGDIDEQGRAKGEPELAVLVVRQSDGLPGQGWWINGGSEGYVGSWEGPSARKHVARLQLRTFTYWREEDRKRQR